jgi:N-acetylmuramoyl-L-alanine amidase
MKTILLIPGHGGADPGAVNTALSDATTEEEDINLEVCLALRTRLRDLGHNVLMSRDRDFYVAPADQLRLIRQTRPDCAIAIHANASANGRTQGIETFYRDDADKVLAGILHKWLVVHTARADRGVHQDLAYLKRRLAVLSDLEIRAVLVELAYITNPDDFEYMTDNPQTIAEAIAEGITEWASTGKAS